MTKATLIPASDEAWESGALGADERHVTLSTTVGVDIDDALDLQLISIRLPKAMIDDLKFIADREGLKYQPLIRRVLKRWVNGEMRQIARDLSAAEGKRQPVIDPEDPPLRQKCA